MPSPSLSDLLVTLYGVRTFTRENDMVSSIGLTATQILRQNPQRVGMVIYNLSANSIYIGAWPDVSSSKGIILAANGGWASMVWDRDFEIISQSWWGVAAGAGSAMLTLEYISL